MAVSSIPLDVLNPGQVFACLGLMEATLELVGECKAGFDWSDPAGDRFVLRCGGETEPVPRVLDFLLNCEVRFVMPAIGTYETSKWGVSCRQAEGFAYPSRPPGSAATLAAELAWAGETLLVDYWADSTRDNAKFWAGSGGYPGAARLQEMLGLVRRHEGAFRQTPFDVADRMSSSYRLDWRRDYVPIDAGFSPNNHASIVTIGYPGVEILAAIGLGHARPLRHQKLAYSYGIVGRRDGAMPLDSAFLQPPFVRAALGCVDLPFPARRFDMRLSLPGKHERAITQVTETTNR